MRKIVLGAALALGLATPALAADCCEKKDGKTSACCEKAAKGEKMACCEKHEGKDKKAETGHDGHASHQH
jgi:opacity protein-like surface antigen